MRSGGEAHRVVDDCNLLGHGVNGLRDGAHEQIGGLLLLYKCPVSFQTVCVQEWAYVLLLAHAPPRLNDKSLTPLKSNLHHAGRDGTLSVQSPARQRHVAADQALANPYSAVVSHC
jgi:hypothetical protein